MSGTTAARRPAPGARVIEYPAAPHAFLTTPGVTAQAEQARSDIAEFLRAALAR